MCSTSPGSGCNPPVAVLRGGVRELRGAVSGGGRVAVRERVAGRQPAAAAAGRAAASRRLRRLQEDQGLRM